MIIHYPEKVVKDGSTILWAKIEFEKKQDRLPEYLWYRIPNQFAEFLTLQSDAFLIPGLLAGMQVKESIAVRGPVSPRLAYDLEEYQYVLNLRMPEYIQPVEIKYNELKPLAVLPKGVGSLFSGGVDSLFALWKHLPQNQPNRDFQISSSLFIRGFDIGLNEENQYQILFSRYQKVLKGLNIDLIPLETNLVSIVFPRLKFNLLFGPILAGCIHALSGLFKRFYIPSSRAYTQFRLRYGPATSGPLTDRLLSSETLDMIHFGAAYSRVEKIREISDWAVAHQNLRVCTNSDFEQGYSNCSRCEKCIRTMLPIYALGKMDKFMTFEKPLENNYEGLWWARKFNPAPGFVREIFPFAKKHKRDFVPWLRVAALLGYLRYWIVQIIPGFVKDLLRRFGYFEIVPMEKFVFEDEKVIKLIEEKIGTSELSTV
jgi:hypothetical protein